MSFESISTLETANSQKV